MQNIIIPEVNNQLSGFTYIPNFFSKEYADIIRDELDKTDGWKIGFNYQKNKVQRKQKWFQIDNQSFCKNWKVQYDRWESHLYTDTLLKLQNDLELNIQNFLPKHKSVQIPKFNSLLINYYQDGNNFIAPHQDSKESFGSHPTIALLSFGETRKFILERTFEDNLKRNKEEYHLNQEFNLDDNSLLIMSGSSQRYFCHSIVKELDKSHSRFSLTFREYID
jgi:alkylated DNA repair dioxygenase AlkB